MDAVVVLLDDEHTTQVVALWEELERELGVHVARDRAPWPHISFQGGDEYDVPAVEALLRSVASETAPLVVPADGLGIFAGPQPVLYVPVQRVEALNRLHARLWEALSPNARGLSPYYAPERWVAHVTLAQWDIPPDRLGNVVAHLTGRPLAWEMRLVALGLVVGSGDGPSAAYQLHARYPLGG